MKSDKVHPREARLTAKHAADVELTNARTAMVKLRAERDSLVVAKQKGELLDKRRVALSLGFLLTCFRQRLLTFHYSLPPRLEGKSAHEMGEILRAEVHVLLTNLAQLPSQLADPNWESRIDEDLRPAPQVVGNGDKDAERRREQRERYNARRRERRTKAKEAYDH